MSEPADQPARPAPVTRRPVVTMRDIAAAAAVSQSTVSRLENLPSRTDLYRMARALVDQYCASFPQVPDRIVLDLDDTFDATHGAQQLQLFNAHYDEHGFQPIVIFDAGGRLVTAVLRPAKRPSGREILTLLERVVGRIRANWPAVRITLRGDSHYACPEVMAGLSPGDTATSSAWPAPNPCTGAPPRWLSPPWTGMRRSKPPIPRCRPRRRSAASPNSTTAPKAGRGSGASSPVSKRATRASMSASS